MMILEHYEDYSESSHTERTVSTADSSPRLHSNVKSRVSQRSLYGPLPSTPVPHMAGGNKKSGRALTKQLSARFLASVRKESAEIYEIEQRQETHRTSPSTSPRRRMLKAASDRFLGAPRREQYKEASCQFDKLSESMTSVQLSESSGESDDDQKQKEAATVQTAQNKIGESLIKEHSVKCVASVDPKEAVEAHDLEQRNVNLLPSYVEIPSSPRRRLLKSASERFPRSPCKELSKKVMDKLETIISKQESDSPVRTICTKKIRVIPKKGSARYLSPVRKEFAAFFKNEEPDSNEVLGSKDSPKRRFLKSVSEKYLKSPRKAFSSLEQAVDEFHDLSNSRHDSEQVAPKEPVAHSPSVARQDSPPNSRGSVYRSPSAPRLAAKLMEKSTEFSQALKDSSIDGVDDPAERPPSPRLPIFKKASVSYVASRNKKLSSPRKQLPPPPLTNAVDEPSPKQLPPPPFVNADIFDDYEQISSMVFVKQ